jgi:hypothetical protein
VGKKEKQRQAGAELCQAQDKLGLAKPSLPSKKLSHETLRSSSIYQNIESSSVFQNIEVAFFKT